MDNSEFSDLAENTLESLYELLESSDKGCVLDIDYTGDGVLQIELEDGKTYVINKHRASQQIWWSSPFSGAKHFSFNEKSQSWIDSSGVIMDQLIRDEFHKRVNIIINS